MGLIILKMDAVFDMLSMTNLWCLVTTICFDVKYLVKLIFGLENPS